MAVLQRSGGLVSLFYSWYRTDSYRFYWYSEEIIWDQIWNACQSKTRIDISMAGIVVYHEQQADLENKQQLQDWLMIQTHCRRKKNGSEDRDNEFNLEGERERERERERCNFEGQQSDEYYERWWAHFHATELLFCNDFNIMGHSFVVHEKTKHLYANILFVSSFQEGRRTKCPALPINPN